MNTIDKVILTNIKMSEKDMGINISAAVAVCIGAILSYLASYTDFAWYGLIIVAMYGIERTYEKMFYSSIFGNTAYLYNCFPIKTKDNVIGKVLAASFIVFCYIGVLMFMYLLELITEEGFWNGLIISYGLIAIKSLQLIALVISVISQSTYIFLSVVIFNTKLKIGHSKSIKLLFVLTAGVIFVLLYYTPMILYINDVMSDEWIITLISLALTAALIIPLGQKTILLLDSKYVQR